MSNCKRSRTILIAVIVLFGASDVGAQWVFVARKAVGRIERMTQTRTSGVPSYDVATVVIEGKAEKVYRTALKAIEATPNLHITRQDPGQRIIDFSDGNRAAGLKVSQVNEKVVHLLIASVVMPDQDSTTSFVVSGVMRICMEVGANCTLEQ